MARPGMMLYFDILPALDKLPSSAVGELLLGALHYAQDGVEPAFEDSSLAFAWAFLRPAVDRDGAAYDEKQKRGDWLTYCRQRKKDGVDALDFETWRERVDNGTLRYVDVSLPTTTTSPSPTTSTTPTQKQLQPIDGAAATPPAPAPQDPKEFGFGPDLTAAFDDWLKYKREKRQEYKPTGLAALVSQVRNNAAKYGEAAVAALIRQCMAANWQGIIWDKLDKPPAPSGGGKPGKYTEQDFQPTPERIQKNAERLDAFLAEQEGKSKWNLSEITRL